MDSVVFRGNFICAVTPNRFTAYADTYIRVDDRGVIIGVDVVPYPGEVQIDLGEGFVIPAFTDLHLHSSQLPMTGLGCDGTVEEWFVNYCHPTEGAYKVSDYADRVNRALVEALVYGGSLHAVIMSSVSEGATKNLYNHLCEAGIGAYLGKMNSDYSEDGSPNESMEESLNATGRLIESFQQNSNVHYILSPEYVPACSADLLLELGNLAQKRKLPVQSHMNEGNFDTEAVARRFPEEKTYARVWEKYGLCGNTPTVMAHCTVTSREDLRLMAAKGVFLAYCPDAIVHIPSGDYLNVKECMNMGLPVGLGSDIGGGHTLDMRQVIVNAVMVSKVNGKTEHLTLGEAFFLATKGGGSFFGDTGSFENGYFFDALVIDDSWLRQFREYTLEERLARFLYSGSNAMINVRYYHGMRLHE